MARESKRKRDEKRFGNPERLADFMRSQAWALPNGMNRRSDDKAWADKQRGLMLSASQAKIIDFTNVFDYIESLDSARGGWKELIVNATPAFDFCFLECQVDPRHSPQVRGIGWALEAYPKADAPQFIHDAIEHAANSPQLATCEKFDAPFEVPTKEHVARCAKFVVGSMCLRLKIHPHGNLHGIICPTLQALLMLDDSGASILPPLFAVSEEWIEIGQSDWLTHWGKISMFGAMMAFCFMNCRNVSLGVVEPDPVVNRMRRAGGLHPFLRYHTINIEPMKATLRTEGNIEANGLKKALHICRGHFATYTEDKPLFGHFTGTVWKPAHVRGSSKNGIVVSDYDVKSPAS